MMRSDLNKILKFKAKWILVMVAPAIFIFVIALIVALIFKK